MSDHSIRSTRDSYWFPAALLALAMVLAALFLASAIRDFKLADRYVEVKGLAEREVPADLAIWPVTYNLAADSLENLESELARTDEAVIAFLKLHGFGDGEISRTPPRITDYLAQGYNAGNRPENRYSAERTLTLKTRQVDAARRALQNAGDLVGQGVVLGPAWGSNAQFLFTGLNDIKPEMIAAATADARRAAAQFAEDSGSAVGAIKRARQGYFNVEERDPSTPEVKVVRVVTTVEYFLE